MEGIFATINRKIFFLGREKIFPGQGTIFRSNGGVGGCLVLLRNFVVRRVQALQRDRRDSENRGVGSGRYSLIIYIIYILYNNKQ